MICTTAAVQLFFFSDQNSQNQKHHVNQLSACLVIINRNDHFNTSTHLVLSDSILFMFNLFWKSDLVYTQSKQQIFPGTQLLQRISKVTAGLQRHLYDKSLFRKQHILQQQP